MQRPTRQMDETGCIARGRHFLNHVFQDLHVQLWWSPGSSILTLATAKLNGTYLADVNSTWFADLDDMSVRLDEHSLMDMSFEHIENAKV